MIGARQHNDPGTGAGSGAAYVFTRESGVWGEKAKLTASDAAAGDNFGVSVAVEDDTVVVGSWQDDDNGRNSGSAYVFTKPDLGWASTFETLKLTAPNGAANDRFGWSVAVDLDDQRGDLALVGAYSDDIATGMDAGSVHVLGIPDWMDITGSSNSGTTSHTCNQSSTEPMTIVEQRNRVHVPNPGAEPKRRWSGLGRSQRHAVGEAGRARHAERGRGRRPGDVELDCGHRRTPLSPLSRGTSTTPTAARPSPSIPDSGPSTDNYTVLGLTNLTTYTFAVRAVNVIGRRSFVSTDPDATPASATPAAPNLTATAGDTQVRLKWVDPNDSSIDKYQYSTDGSALGL